MGVVYSSQEVANAAIPQEGAHLKFAELIIAEAPQIEGIEYTTVYGSSVDPDKEPGHRGDGDCKFIYRVDTPESEYDTLSRLRELIERTERETHVKLEPNIWVANESVDARASRLSDRLFSRYLVNAMRSPRWNVGGVDPTLVEIAEQPLDSEQLRNTVLQYLAYKHKGITIAPLDFDDSDKAVKSLQRALELPKALGRKVEQLCILSGDREQDLFSHITSQNGWVYDLTRLGAIDKEYTGYVKELALRLHELRPEDIEEYRCWLTDRYKKVMPLGLMAIRGFTEMIDSEKELALAQ